MTTTTKPKAEKLFCLRCGIEKIKGFYEGGCSAWGSSWKQHLWDNTSKPNGWKEKENNEYLKLYYLFNSHKQHILLNRVWNFWKHLTSQAILSAEERGRDKCKQEFKSALELWMATHDKLGKSFTTDELLKFMEQK